nr:hypothetical protein B0A51_11969 [Rachicladosporium sp. CCFEE 5018]
MAFVNKLAIIAGGVGGIGSATGRLLRSQGLFYAPFEASRVSSVIKQTYTDFDNDDDSIKTYACDITQPESVKEAFGKIGEDRVAVPNMLINSAGYVNLMPMSSLTPEDSLLHYQINVHGPLLCAQAFHALYLEHRTLMQSAISSGQLPSSTKISGARIVNIASQAGHVALKDHGAYCASKAALLALTRQMASEWGAEGVVANSVSPGPVWTELGKKAWADTKAREEYQAAVPTGNFAEPEEVAEIVAFLCKESSKNINGADVRLDGGYTVR